VRTPSALASTRRSTTQARREEILGVTWRLIASQGLRAANMRAIAAAAGYANGALAYYFTSKDDLLRAAFEHVFERTEARIADATRGLAGVAALRRLSREILPDDADKLLEARIVLPFWAEAAQQPAFAALHERSMRIWRAKVRRHLREAQALGEVKPLGGRELGVAVEQLLHLWMGAQVMGVLSPAINGPAMLRGALERFLVSLA
jgi:AcrR family transcriptional regulator